MPEKETEMNAVKKYPVITISREYGALGRTLAAELSERLGIPYYDKDFVKKAADESGYAEEEVKTEGEELKPSSRMLNSILNSAVSYSSSHDAIFKAQKKVVLELAKDPCIIVGRCADHILREAGADVFCIYLYTSKSGICSAGPITNSTPAARWAMPTTTTSASTQDGSASPPAPTSLWKSSAETSNTILNAAQFLILRRTAAQHTRCAAVYLIPALSYRYLI